MPRKRTSYDAACYYDGKLLGRCTKADSDAYTLLMNACGGEAARVLREYAYFSPELKAILEKAALMQADRSRTGGMFHAPKSSPWGEVQSCETLCPGVFLVSAASHGGTMVANEVAAVLSPAAKKCGFKNKGYICYTELGPEGVYRYYSTQRPVDIGTYPKLPDNQPLSIVNYDDNRWRPVADGRLMAWGELTYAKPLTEKQMEDYELKPAPGNPDRARPSITARLKDGTRGQEPQKEPCQKRSHKNHEER